MSEASSRVDWIEIGNAIVLSVAGLLTSWSGYQAALWDGEQAAHYSQANAIHVRASQAATQADTRESRELQLFNAWLTAEVEERHRLAEFYKARFPPDLRTAFDDWIQTKPLQNPDAPPTPFAGDLRARQPGRLEAATLEKQADAIFEKGQRANQVSDDYVQATVFFAMALFFGGICQVFRITPVRLLLLTVAVSACAAAVIKMMALPILKPG